ncbi:MAG: metal-dependent transcriptional regulator [Eubacteriales bacterium]|jgi:DtxR family Mn-dependent transcriptional regulator
MSLKPSGEMYLETIYILSRERPRVRSVDIAEYMNYSKPSVSRGVNLLKKNNYIKIDEDGHITLTEEGLPIAQNIYERHVLISKALTMLGVDEKTAADDACKIEHVISEESFQALKKHMEKN